MTGFIAFLQSLPARQVLIVAAGCLATVTLSMGEFFAVMLSEPEVES